MKFEDAINNIASKNSLRRTANVGESYRADVTTTDLLKRRKTFLDEKRICRECCTFDESFDFRRLLLFLFLNKEDYSIKSDIKLLISEVKELKNYLLKNEEYIQLKDRDKEIYAVVLESIMEDKIVSNDELNVLEKLRNKLGMNIFYHWILRIKKDFFDEVNKIDKISDNKLKGDLRNLERKGLLFHVAKENEKYYLIPDEIASKIKKVFNMELQLKKYEELLNNPVLTNKDKKMFLASQKLYDKGTTDILNKRIIFNGFRPSEFLDSLTTESLSLIAKKIGTKVSGSKKEKINNIIKRYGEIYKPQEELKDIRESYYKFYEELANRNQSVLIKKGIIRKGEEIGKRFEEATKYLFGNILKFTLQDPQIKNRMHGVKADGKAVKNNEFIIWDCKTKDKYLSISTSERRQFIDYINEYKKADRNKFVSFLIITPEIKDSLDIKKKLTEIKKETEVDISAIQASDLKKFAEQVNKSDTDINLTPFYHTTILKYDYLKTFI